MTASDWFGVAVRIIGVWMLVKAMEQLIAFIYLRIEAKGASPLVGDPSSNSYLVYLVGYLLLAFVFLFLADELVRFAYSKKEEETRALEEEGTPRD